MKITPLGNIIQLEIETATAGSLNLGGYESAVEYAKVVAIGENVKDIKVGDNIFVKAWGCDIITYMDKRFYFVSQETKAILAIVK